MLSHMQKKLNTNVCSPIHLEGRSYSHLLDHIKRTSFIYKLDTIFRSAAAASRDYAIHEYHVVVRRSFLLVDNFAS